MAGHDPLRRMLREGLPEWRRPGDPVRLRRLTARRLRQARRRRQVGTAALTAVAVLAVAGGTVVVAQRLDRSEDVALSPVDDVASGPTGSPPPEVVRSVPEPATPSPPAPTAVATPTAAPGPTGAPTTTPAPGPGPSPTTTAPPPSPTPSATAGEAATFASVCPTASPAPTPGRRIDVGDVDGGGRPDALVVTDGRLQLETSVGTTAPLVLDTASPYLVAGFADVDADGREELLLGARGAVGEAIGQRWRVVQVEGCALAVVRNVHGEPYEFEVGRDEDGVLHGLGCVDMDGDGDPELVGTAATPDGEGYDVTRTAVHVDGIEARNGEQDRVRVPADDQAAVATLDTATCGADTLAQHPLG